MGLLAATEWLLEDGREAIARLEGGLRGALEVAAERDDELMLRLLLEKGVQLIGYLATHCKRPRNGNEAMVSLLLYHGAKIDVVRWASTISNTGYRTALQAASSNGQESVVKLLLKAGAQVDAAGPHGTALEVASAGGHETLVRLLLKRRASVDKWGSNGTAL